MARHKDIEWDQPAKVTEWSQVDTALLMDIRDELRLIRRRLGALECPNFLAIPGTLDRLVKNTTKPRKRKVRR